MKGMFAVDFKGFFKGLVLSIIGTALILCFIFIAYSLVFNLVTAKPEKVKGILNKSSLYAQLPAVIYNQSISQVGGGEESILKRPQARQIALDVYDKQFAQDSIEKLIDGLYVWLEGNSTQPPDLNIDLTQKNSEFAAKLGQYAKKRAEKLAPCTLADAQKIQSIKEIDIFKAKCLPAGITPAQIEREAKKLPFASDETLSDALNGKSKQEDTNSPSQASQSNLPQTFKAAKSIPLVLIIIAAALVATIIYLSDGLVDGLKRLSRLSLGAGILTALMPVVFLAGGTALVKNISEDEKIKSIGQSILEQSMSDAGKIYYVVAFTLALAAAGLYIYARKLEEKNDKITEKKS